MQDLLLQPGELVALTGYQRAAEQLRELLLQGFHRARRNRITGEVVLERAHYLAVCQGLQASARPRVHKPPPKVAKAGPRPQLVAVQSSRP